MRLRNSDDVAAFMKAVHETKGDVYLVSIYDKTCLNLKSELSLYLGIGKILDKYGEQFELFAPQDEGKLMGFFIDQSMED